VNVIIGSDVLGCIKFMSCRLLLPMIAVSVCLLRVSTWLHYAKTAERINILFGVNTFGGPRNAASGESNEFDAAVEKLLWHLVFSGPTTPPPLEAGGNQRRIMIISCFNYVLYCCISFCILRFYCTSAAAVRALSALLSNHTYQCPCNCLYLFYDK